jgi:hypothetical protein
VVENWSPKLPPPKKMGKEWEGLVERMGVASLNLKPLPPELQTLKAKKEMRVRRL